MSDALQGGAPRGYTGAPVVIEPTGRAVRRPVDIGIIGERRERCETWVFNVRPARTPHEKFLALCSRLGVMALEPVRGNPVPDAPFTPGAFTFWVNKREHTFHMDDGRGALIATAHADGQETDDGRTVGKEYPIGYVVTAPADTIAQLQGRPFLTGAYPYVSVPRVGGGAGGGVLTERIEKLLRAERREGTYRSGERARGRISDYRDAPAAPAGAVFRTPTLAELFPQNAQRVAADGWRVTGVELDGAEIVVQLERDTPKLLIRRTADGDYTVKKTANSHRMTVREPLSRFACTDDDAIRRSEERRAAELARVSLPAEPEETVRGMGYSINPVSGDVFQREPFVAPPLYREPEPNPTREIPARTLRVGMMVGGRFPVESVELDTESDSVAWVVDGRRIERAGDFPVRVS